MVELSAHHAWEADICDDLKSYLSQICEEHAEKIVKELRPWCAVKLRQRELRTWRRLSLSLTNLPASPLMDFGLLGRDADPFSPLEMPDFGYIYNITHRSIRSVNTEEFKLKMACACLGITLVSAWLQASSGGHNAGRGSLFQHGGDTVRQGAGVQWL